MGTETLTSSAASSAPAASEPDAAGQHATLTPARRRRLTHLGLLPVLALSAGLNLHHLARNGYGNVFYSAAARSMLVSLHNFLFASFDPGGLINVDKPPLALWVQAASAKVFGFSPLSLLVPEALIGVLCVAALYAIVQRRFGVLAGLAAALALAVYPSMVAVSRDNGVDPLLILLMIIACGAALRAIETGGWLPLLGCALSVGLAFNTKTLAAYLVVPGIAAAYLLCAPGRLFGRLGKLTAAGLVMLAVSFAWIAVVELTPASQRPYVGSSTNNTELGLTFSYNGFGRVGGEVGGPGNIPVGTGALGLPAAASATRKPVRSARSAANRQDQRRRVPIFFVASPGPLRLFGTGLGEQGGWLLPFAFFALLAMAVGWLRRARRSQAPQGVRRDPRLAALIVLGGWFVVEAVTLSLSKGIVHPYYVSALAPGTAALLGAGAVAMSERRDRRILFVPFAVAATVVVEILLLNREHYLHWFQPLLIGGTATAVLALLALRRLMRPAMALVLALLLVAPAAIASTTWSGRVYGTFPAAGPRQALGRGLFGLTGSSLKIDKLLARYVRAHDPGRSWAVLTVSSDTAAPLILLGLPAGTLAGYSGTDPALDGPGLARLVARQQARYVVLGGAYATRGGNAATVAVQRACKVVPAAVWRRTPYSAYSLVLFDCAGRARQLAAA